jgi:[CysO sulfur-carrier protein]-S-L-cysteine hydrolase
LSIGSYLNKMTRLCLPADLLPMLLAHAESAAPLECVGLLAGEVRDGVAVVKVHFPLVNALASPVAYEAELKGLLAAHRKMRELGLREVAIYHSHPTSAPVPSRTDLQRNGYGEEIIHLILGRETEAWLPRAWLLGENDYWPVEMEVNGG